MKHIQSLLALTLVCGITACSKPDNKVAQSTKPEIGPYGYITAQSDFSLVIHKSQDIFVKENDCELGIRIEDVKETITNDVRTTALSYSYVFYKNGEYSKGKNSYESTDTRLPISFDSISISWSPCGLDRVYIYFKEGQKFKIQDDHTRFIQQFED